MQPNIIERVWRQDKMVNVDVLNGFVFTGEAGAHKFVISGKNVNTPVDISGTITANFKNADNVLVPLGGTIEDGKAVVVLSPECYAVEGPFSLMIFADTVCIYAAIANAINSSGEVIAYPTATIPSVQELIEEVQDVIASIPQDYSALNQSVQDLKSAVGYTDYPIETSGLYRIGDGSVTIGSPTTNQYYKCAAFVCVPGDEFTISGKSYGSAARLYGFAESDGTIIEAFPANATATNLELIAPADSAYLVVNEYLDTGYDVTVNGVIIKDRVDSLENAVDYMANVKVTEKFTGNYTLGFFNNMVLKIGSGGYIAVVEMQNGGIYDIETSGTYNRFAVATGNSFEADATLAWRYNGTPGASNSYTYTNTDNYKYLFVWLNNGTDDFDATCSIIEKIGELNNIKFNGVPIYDREQTAVASLESIRESLPYSNVFNGYINKYVSGNTLADSNQAWGTLFDTSADKYYHIRTTGAKNRFILYGIKNNTITEIFRYTSGEVDYYADYSFQNTAGYTSCYLFLSFTEEPIALDVDCTIYESNETPLPQFSLMGVDLLTADDKSKLLREASEHQQLKVTTVKLPAVGVATPTNLCFVAAKTINEDGCVPDCSGYLYFDNDTQKFYYSNNTPYNPVYLFDWDSSLANNEHCKNWNATITADGDIIFLKYYARSNPIIYPHTDYSSPYIVDFGSSKKPYGWCIGSSVVQFDDGSFVFGDYAAHSLEDEQNDDRRIIWRVTKPYNNPTNWVQAHSFKHVYYTSNKSDEPDNEIGHIHAIMYDFYSDDLYCTTGDIDRHCRMWISADHGVTWAAVPGAVGTTEDTTVQAEGQKWRMTNAIFTEDAIWWATDAQKPYHKLWKCTRNIQGHIDFSTLSEVIDIEVAIRNTKADTDSQRTYMTVLMRSPYGLLLMDRGEPLNTNLRFTFYGLKSGNLSIVYTFDRAETEAGELEPSSRIGVPMQCTTPYQPQCINGVITGGGTIIRPNNTGLFNNSLTNYIGTMILEL